MIRPRVQKALPELWALIQPRKWIFLSGMMLVLLNRVAGLALPYLSKPFVDQVMTKHKEGALNPLILAVFVSTAIQAAASFANTQLVSRESLRMVAELRQRVQQHVGRLHLEFYDSHRTGAVASRIMNDVDGVRNLIGSGILDFVGGALTAVIAFGFLLHQNPRVTLIIFGVITVFVGFIQGSFKTIRPLLRERAQITGEVTGRLTESLGGIRVVKAYHAERREAEIFTNGVMKLLAKVIESTRATTVLSMASTSALGIVGGLVMLLSGRLALAHRMNPGDYIQYTLFLAYTIAPLMQLVSIGTQLTEALAGIDRTVELLQESDEFADPDRSEILFHLSGIIQFENVGFSYNTESMALRNISFSASPGTVTALVGSSGSGKSTITNLLCGFYKPTVGRILIDGVDLLNIDLSFYRSQLGVVLQESFLFDGSIRENIMLPRPNAMESEFLSACAAACVDLFAEDFTDKYETVVGERGVKLSGGQRQRIAIARAILANPRLLILDEATSSLDSESELLIQQGLSRLTRGRTTFVIAHRLSTIQRADQILVVEEGQIVERGTHSELHALNGRYNDLYTRQYGVERNLFLSPGEGGEDEGASNG